MTQIILFDIFSYSCMNCLRSLDYIKKISDKYRKYGLKTTLVHPPEWEFEKNKKNIYKALKKYKINLPLIIDKDKRITKKLKINFWPAQILVKSSKNSKNFLGHKTKEIEDFRGFENKVFKQLQSDFFVKNKILYKHIGEGNYKELEDKIIKVLKIKSNAVFDKEPKYTKFPTVYAGKKKKGRISKLKNKLNFGIVYINGKWKQNNEFLQGKGSLIVKTKGKTVNYTAGSINNKSINVKVKINNKSIKKIKINEPRLYNIIRLKNNKPKKLTLETKSKLAIYSFAFQ